MITEIQIIPIKPTGGLVGFASLVLLDSLYLGSIGIMTKPEGGFRLTYPTKRVGLRNLNIYHPIRKQLADEIEQQVISKYREVTEKSNEYLAYENSTKY